MNIFDYDGFGAQIDKLKDQYNFQSPYPYAIFDGLFEDAILNEVVEEIEKSEFVKDVREIDGVEVKTRSNLEDNESLPVASRQLFELINGGRFLNMVSELTGISGLISDPYYDGGGINIIEGGGTLAVHVDGTTQHRMQICRRLNAILFLNNDWDVDWNGYHEQWDFVNKSISPLDPEQQWRCIRKILPKRNRLLIFTTNDHSWHGHAGVLKVPKGVRRFSLITYYYTSSRPSTDLMFESPHRAMFINNKITLTDDAFADVEVVL